MDERPRLGVWLRISVPPVPKPLPRRNPPTPGAIGDQSSPKHPGRTRRSQSAASKLQLSGQKQPPRERCCGGSSRLPRISAAHPQVQRPTMRKGTPRAQESPMAPRQAIVVATAACPATPQQRQAAERRATHCSLEPEAPDTTSQLRNRLAPPAAAPAPPRRRQPAAPTGLCEARGRASKKGRRPLTPHSVASSSPHRLRRSETPDHLGPTEYPAEVRLLSTRRLSAKPMPSIASSYGYTIAAEDRGYVEGVCPTRCAV